MPKEYVRYGRMGLVLLTTAGFLLLSFYVKTWTEHNVFPVLFPAVVLSSWFGGRLGGVLATFALSCGTAYYHLPPVGFAISDPADVIRLATFMISGGFVAWMSGALKESQGVMAATLRSIGDGVIATDRHGRVRFLNPVAESLTGWSQKDAKGQVLSEVFKGVDPGTGEGLQVPPLGTVSYIENTCLISKGGDRVPVDDSLAPIEVDSGRSFGSILVFRDATKRLQTEATLLESQRQHLQAQRMEAVGRLAGGVAHDFNNLLTIINGYADLTLKDMAHDNPGRALIEQIRKAGEQASKLTRQLLIFSRGQPAKLEIVDLNRVVANFEKMLRRLIGDDVLMFTALSASPVPVEADVGQIEQVIMNLALNARDAMPGGGRLTLKTEVQELVPTIADTATGTATAPVRYAVLSVQDTGIGIDEEAQSRLFEPFYTTKELGKGTGLGLSVTYGIVKSHGGHLCVDSHPGEGSLFQVFFPLAGSLPEPVDALPILCEPPHGAATILLVEDNPDVRELMRGSLTDLGYIVLDAPGSQEALRLAEIHPEPIDLLVTDVVMPGLSGLELAKRLAQTRPQMRVLYVSGYSDHENAAEVLADPEVAYLQKPFAPTDLAFTVAQLISRPKQKGADQADR
jgi:two-component system cell cycle sensor histidine kinase/response regulator CckA